MQITIVFEEAFELAPTMIECVEMAAEGKSGDEAGDALLDCIWRVCAEAAQESEQWPRHGYHVHAVLYERPERGVDTLACNVNVTEDGEITVDRKRCGWIANVARRMEEMA